MIRFIIFLICPALLFSETFKAKVVRVVDGDSVNILRISDNKELRLRLYGIDAPEWKQAYGKESKEALKELLGGNSEASVTVLDKDRYGRLICELDIKSEDIPVNQWMVSQGYAWHYIKYAPNDIKLQSAEENARINKLGLWSSENPIPPWNYRKND
tara:strand:- start:467 stop:937 length:471 start_codon:yes stop_codon:yes gene_type:complete